MHYKVLDVEDYLVFGYTIEGDEMEDIAYSSKNFTEPKVHAALATIDVELARLKEMVQKVVEKTRYVTFYGPEAELEKLESVAEPASDLVLNLRQISNCISDECDVLGRLCSRIDL